MTWQLTWNVLIGVVDVNTGGSFKLKPVTCHYVQNFVLYTKHFPKIKVLLQDNNSKFNISPEQSNRGSEAE